MISSSHYEIREVSTPEEIEEVKRLVRAHGDARREVPGVEYVYADAARMPGPYVPPRGGLWLAMSGDRGIGCVALRPLDETSAEVKRMFVDEAWRGLGVGRALLERLIRGARDRGYEILKLGTLDDMLAAQGLYNSLGFTPIGRYRDDELIDTRFYELTLTS
jgi:putative acetyltransferase